jgi:hypothetical protein
VFLFYSSIQGEAILEKIELWQERCTSSKGILFFLRENGQKISD